MQSAERVPSLTVPEQSSESQGFSYNQYSSGIFGRRRQWESDSGVDTHLPVMIQSVAAASIGGIRGPKRSHRESNGIDPCRKTASKTGRLFHYFCENTSIRGARRAVKSEFRFLRCFWSAFVTISLLSVATIGFFCLQSYVTFQTVVQRHSRLLLGADFPVVTLCSSAFFRDTDDSRRLLNHPLAFKKYLETLSIEALQQRNFTRLYQILSLKSTVMYNVNNFPIWRDLPPTFLDIHTAIEFNVVHRNHSDIICFITRPMDAICKIQPFYDFRYRNCLSIKVPIDKHSQPVEEMMIVVVLLTGAHPVNFIQDEIQLSYFVKIFLHEANTLPRTKPDFVVTLDSHQWAVVDFEALEDRRLVTPRSYCVQGPIPNTTHAGAPVRIDPQTCEVLHQRELVRNNCHCEAWWPPLDRWPLKTSDLCGAIVNGLEQAEHQIDCMTRVERRDSIEEIKAVLEKEKKSDVPSNLPSHGPKCEQPCIRRSYSAHSHYNEFNKFVYKSYIREVYQSAYIGRLLQECDDGPQENIKPVCRSHEKALDQLLRNVNAEVDFEPFGDGPSMPPLHGKAKPSLTRLAFPNLSSSDEESSPLRKRFLSLRVRSRTSQIQVDVETEMRTLWTTLAQLGGAASFFAGFSFMVIGEVVELVYRLWKSPK